MHTLATLHLFTIVNRVACSSLMGCLGASLHCINDGVATDPACGVGKFLLEAASKVPNSFYFKNGILKNKLLLYGMEKRMEDNNDDLTTILAKANFLIYYSDLFKNNSDSNTKIQKLAGELLNTVIKSSHSVLGTLDNLTQERFDLILANPPYYQSAVITEASKAVKISGSTSKAYTTGGRGIESLFTEWIVKSLKKGGEANVILPDGIFTNIANDKLKNLFWMSVSLRALFPCLLEHFSILRRKLSF